VKRAKYLSNDEGRRDPVEVTELLGPLLESIGTGAGMDSTRLFEEWAAVAGERWAGPAQPVGIRSGILLVEVVRGSDASLLKFDVPALISRIAARFGPDLVTGVRFRVAAPRKSP
jgi:hypothetical protein